MDFYSSAIRTKLKPILFLSPYLLFPHFYFNLLAAFLKWWDVTPGALGDGVIEQCDTAP
jgi:hypothetical protein